MSTNYNLTNYKLAYIVNNLIKKLYVFIGNIINKSSDELNELFKQEPNNPLFSGIFTEEELSNALLLSNVVFIKEKIYLDDTIETIKKKLISKTDINVSFGEIYLFTRQLEILSSITTYKNLTQNDKLELTKDRLIHYLLNREDIDFGSLEDKEVYTYNDLLKLNLDNKPYIINKPIGQKFVAIETNFPYTINPYNVLSYDKFLERYASELTTTTNNNLLMNTGDMVNNTIYLCTAIDVLNYSNSQSLSIESTIKIYFPYLFEHDIKSLLQIEENKQQLLSESESTISSIFERNTENVNLFYNVFLERKIELPYKEQGIKEISFIIHPDYQFNIPLDIVFKLIHATKEVPLIKYNPSKKLEKVFRLYADRISTSGKRIPYMNKADIFKLIKTIGKNKSVSVYINRESIEIICDFESNGSITIRTTFTNSKTIEYVNELIRVEVNPIIDIVKNYFEQSGYTMNNFNELKNKNIEILNILYSLQIPIKKKIKLKGLMGCASTIFNMISDDIEKGISLRFKRVSNYNEMDSQEAFIVDLLTSGSRENEVIQGLVDNYSIDPDTARLKFSNFVSSLQIVQDAFSNKKLKIKNNPGFLITMVKEDFEPNLIVNISGINDMKYFETIPIYIDSLLRMSQFSDSTNILPTKINELCSRTKVTEEEKIVDLVALSEKPYSENKQMNIIAEELTFDVHTEVEELEKNVEEGEDMLSILFGFDDEDEGDIELEGGNIELEGGNIELEGGNIELEGEKNKNNKQQIGSSKSPEEMALLNDFTGKNLGHPNLFQSRMEERDPSLFITENEGQYNSYSRSCPWNTRRQPVILTDKEKKNIDENHPGSYDEAVYYGSEKEKQFWYICPRYWSLKDNASLTEEEVESGKYGEIIPPGAKKVPTNGNIFEFTDKKYHTASDGSYVKHYPGFLKKEKHPQEKCIPCCFSDWNSPSQKERRSMCLKEEILDETGEKKQPTLARQKSDTADDYIKGVDKFPLEQNRYGYLPISIQKFLHTDNKKCQISVSDYNIKPNHVCMVRHGVEASRSQSFIACISDIWVGVNKKKKILSIIEMKNKMIESLDLDIFLTLQNGTLVDSFYDLKLEKTNDSPLDTIDFEPYSQTQIYKITDKTNESQSSVLRKIIISYINFCNFLKDDKVEINYKYLWDLICFPNPKLFVKGLNMVIIELLNDDITDNVQIICPSNHYSSTFFDENKQTIILMKKENYYEPIYAFEDKVKEFDVTRQFSLKYKNTLPNIKYMLELIKKHMNKSCLPLNSLPNSYKFKKNIPLDNIIRFLELKSYEIETQIINYNSQVIGVIAKKNNLKGVIPCFPSPPKAELKTIWMDDKYNSSYEETLSFLNNVYKDLNGKLLCKPMLKVIEDGLIVGIITETNQFIGVSEPIQDTFGDDLPIINETNYAVVDKIIMTEKSLDYERIDYIRKIKLENGFFNIFRNTARTILGQYRYKELRNNIESIIASKILYLQKLKSIEKLLRELMENQVKFTEYTPELLSELSLDNNCYTDNADKCSANYCLYNENSCALLIPSVNLINGRNNDLLYFGRLTDEIVRYNRIKAFILQPNTFFSFTDIKYNLREDEILLLQSLITQEYFEGLIPASLNTYVNFNTYENEVPSISQKYSNEINISNENKDISDIETQCGKTTISDLVSSLKPLFPIKSTELEFNSMPELCSFHIILTLIKQDNIKNINITINEVKEVLLDKYTKISEEYSHELLQILNSEGKKDISKQVLIGQITLENMIMSNEYYVTNLDLWVLAIHFNIPLILISTTSLIEAKGKQILIASSDGSDKFYFIKSPGMRTNNIPIYKLIFSPVPIGAKIPIDKLALSLQEEIKSGQGLTGQSLLNSYISTFLLSKAKKVVKIKRKILKKEEGIKELERIKELEGIKELEELEKEESNVITKLVEKTIIKLPKKYKKKLKLKE
jgi:hypothetical protein